jgi:uncharacterized protein YkwD
LQATKTAPRHVLLLGCLMAATTLLLVPPLAAKTSAAGACTTSRPSGSADSEEQTMLSLINSYRSRSGVPALANSASLSRAALWKSTDMANNHYFSHDDLSRGWLQRIQDCGYTSMNDGENIAEGHAAASDTFEQWRTSPPHNQNLLSSTFDAIGVGRAQSPGGDWYWTADFGPSADTASSLASPSTTGPGAPPAPPPPPSAASSPWLLPPLAPTAATHGTIAVGVSVVSNTPGDCLRARTSPSLSSTASVCLPDGSSLFLIDGPVSADGHTWWAAFGAGWVASDYLRPSS